ncbi:hypothetical protein BH10ACT2_BH10ACT2_00130 [soil metagenome]
MEANASLNLLDAARLLRRWWFIPVLCAVLGVGIGVSTISSSNVVVAESTVVVENDPAIEFLASTWVANTNSWNAQLGPSLSELASALTASDAVEALGDAVNGTAIAVTAVEPDTLTLRISADSGRQAVDASNAYVGLIVKLRKDSASEISRSALATIDEATRVLQEYIDGSSSVAELSDGTRLQVFDRGDAAEVLVRLQLLSGTAQQIGLFDGRVTTSTAVQGSSGSNLPAALLGFVFMCLGVALVLVLGPLDSRLRTRRDIRQVTDAPLLAVSSKDDDRLVQVASAVAGLREPMVYIVSVGGRDATSTASTVQATLNEHGSNTAVRAISLADTDLLDIGQGDEPVLVVVRSGQDRRTDLARVCHSLEGAARPVAGVAMLDVRPRDAASVLR